MCSISRCSARRNGGQLIEDWNATDTAYPRQRCLHELYAEQAARTPDAVAVACDDLRLSYAELERRANQLAHRLIRLGSGRKPRWDCAWRARSSW